MGASDVVTGKAVSSIAEQEAGNKLQESMSLLPPVLDRVADVSKATCQALKPCLPPPAPLKPRPAASLEDHLNGSNTRRTAKVPAQEAGPSFLSAAEKKYGTATNLQRASGCASELQFDT